jgi:hypothetical protein
MAEMRAEDAGLNGADRPGPATVAGVFVASASIEVVPGQPAERSEEDGDA